MAIIEQYGDGLSQEAGREDQINCTVTIDVARLDAKAAVRCNNPDKFGAQGGQMKLNPIAAILVTALPQLYVCDVGEMITIEIGDGKRRGHS